MDNISIKYQNVNASSLKGVNDLNLNIKDSSGISYLREMNEGDSFRGTVTDINGNEVTIRVNDTTVSAKLSSDMNLSVGQSVVFNVGTDNENIVSLRPLFTNLSTEGLANNAINAASLPINDVSLSLVSTLLEEGMSIDKETITSLYRQISMNPDIPMNEIVRMNKIGLELNPDNIAKFDAVYNFESKISDSINTVINRIPLETARLADSDIKAAISLASDFISASNDKTEVSVSLGENGSFEGEFIDENQVNDNVLKDENESVLNQKINEILDDMSDYGNVDSSINEEGRLNLSENVVLSNKDFDNLSRLISDNNSYGNQVLDKLSEGNKIDLETLLKTFDSVLKDDTVSDEAKKNLLQSDLFKNAISDKFSEKWLLEPSEVKNGSNLNDRYNSILQDTDRIINSMQNSLKASENLTSAVSDFRDNVAFLQNLNDLASYVQIPVMMNKNANTGDLYVYADKKSLLEKNDNITAVLRLDMNNLGRVEVYVKLSSSNSLSTDFTLENEETLDFIEDHIYMLNKRLDKLGYKVNNSFKLKSKDADIFSGSSPDEESANGSLLNMYRFDVRA